MAGAPAVTGDLFTATEAAAELRVSRWKVYELVRRGIVRPVPWTRHIRVHVEELDRVKRLTSLDVMCASGAEPDLDLGSETLPAPPAHTPTHEVAP
jgi:excisionase family DNA binding protein